MKWNYRIPFFFKVRIAAVLRFKRTFLPSIITVFFWMFGLKVRFVRRNEKLTLCPCCFPFPVKSHTAILTLFTLLFTICLIISHFRKKVKWCIIYSMTIFFSLITILIAMVVHEFAHGFSAYLLGDETAKKDGRLTLNPLAHMDPYISVILPLICALSGLPVIGGAKPVPVNSRELKGGKWGMSLVAFAGPLSNFIMAFIAFAIMRTFNVSYGGAAQFLAIFINVNLSLMLFNLIPIPPLDGSKIISPIAPEFVQNFFEKMEEMGAIVILAVMFVFSTAISNFILLGMSIVLTGFANFLALFGI